MLSSYQLKLLRKAYDDGLKKIGVSLDLGLTEDAVRIDKEGFALPDGVRLFIKDVDKMLKDEESCFILAKNSQILKAMFFMENKLYKLVPTGLKTPPTLAISGVRMHRVKDTNPLKDAQSKIRAISPVEGKKVLDTCMGLGYSAIDARKAGAHEVVCFEKHAGVVEMSKVNPWSARLWTDGRIRVVEGDVFSGVDSFDGEYFDRIIHDPPAFALAGQLYSGEFYLKLYRVLSCGGILYHYVGSPGSRYRDKNLLSGVIHRLKECGFTRVRTYSDALGVVAGKSGEAFKR